MKFGKKLLAVQNAMPEYSPYFLDYKRLKKLMKRIIAQHPTLDARAQAFMSELDQVRVRMSNKRPFGQPIASRRCAKSMIFTCERSESCRLSQLKSMKHAAAHSKTLLHRGILWACARRFQCSQHSCSVTSRRTTLRSSRFLKSATKTWGHRY